jgi:cell division protein FtsI/penicillin-binding protein 2
VIGFIPIVLALAGGGQASVDYIAIDVNTRVVIADHWIGAEVAIPVGSLVKPFTALAYDGAFPEFVCKGKGSRCWLPKGHGREGFRDALAQSCNAYFLNLARDVDANSLAVTAAKFGIPAPRGGGAEDLIGLGAAWRIPPIALVNAYAELAARHEESRVAEILSGMGLAARSGTAKAIGENVLAKTGTAPCVANRKHAGDGFAIAMAPAVSPRIALLVRVHGVTGAETAKSVSAILRELGVGR